MLGGSAGPARKWNGGARDDQNQAAKATRPKRQLMCERKKQWRSVTASGATRPNGRRGGTKRTGVGPCAQSTRTKPHYRLAWSADPSARWRRPCAATRSKEARRRQRSMTTRRRRSPRAASGARRAGADLVAIPAATNFLRRAPRVAQKARSMARHALRAAESALRMPRIAVAVARCLGQRACVARLPRIGGALAAVLVATRVRDRLPRIDGAAVRVTSVSVDDNRSARLWQTRKALNAPSDDGRVMPDEELAHQEDASLPAKHAHRPTAPKELRGARFRSAPPQSTLDPYRLSNIRLAHDVDFFVVMGFNGSIYDVHIALQPKCNRPDFVKRTKEGRPTPCKHILFVFMNVLKLEESDHPMVSDWPAAVETAVLVDRRTNA
ncbi:E3 ubiquitin-protein ligase Zswim2 [Gracilaria domingensis]|nr:E3 ubiquitin-protein ligase Zswim2 [Gracilaria domingensis]